MSDFGDNGGANQLRAKLTALQSSGGGTLTFTGGTATIVLANGVLPAITTSSIIEGDGRITISGSNANYIFGVDNGGTLALDNLRISHGFNRFLLSDGRLQLKQ